MSELQARYMPPKRTVKLLAKDTAWTGLTKPYDGSEWYTTGHYAVRLTVDECGLLPVALFGVAEEGRPDIAPLLTEMESYKPIFFAGIWQTMIDRKLVDLVRFASPAIDAPIHVKRVYLDIVLTRYPTAEVRALDEHHGLLFFVTDLLREAPEYVVGLIMPVIP